MMKWILCALILCFCFPAESADRRRAMAELQKRQRAGAADVTSGRVQWWQFNEGSGTDALNSVGGGADGVLTDGAAFVAGAVSLDGANDYVAFSAKVLPLGAKTLAMWVTATTGASASLWDQTGTSSTSHGDTVFITAGGNVSWFSAKGTMGVNRFEVTTSGTVASGVRTHVCLTWDGTTGANAVKIYLDGSFDAQGTAAATESTAASNNLRIGLLGAPFAGSFPLDGEIDDARVYDRALSAGEVAQLYAFGL